MNRITTALGALAAAVRGISLLAGGAASTTTTSDADAKREENLNLVLTADDDDELERWHDQQQRQPGLVRSQQRRHQRPLLAHRAPVHPELGRDLLVGGPRLPQGLETSWVHPGLR